MPQVPEPAAPPPAAAAVAEPRAETQPPQVREANVAGSLSGTLLVAAALSQAASVAGPALIAAAPYVVAAAAVVGLFYIGWTLWDSYVSTAPDLVSPVQSPQGTSVPGSGSSAGTTTAPPQAVPIPITITIPRHGNAKNNPNPHIVYEIWGYNPLTSNMETLKYGIADLNFSTFFGKGNSRPHRQLAKLQAKYPHLIVSYSILHVTLDRLQALALEIKYVTDYTLLHGTPPPENILPRPKL